MPAPTYVSGTTGTTSLTLPATATASGDILICSAGDLGAITDSLAGTYNGGAWTRFISVTNALGYLSLWWSRATEDHQGDTITKTGMTSMAVTVWRGCLASASPIDTNTGESTGIDSDRTVTGFDTTVAATMTLIVASRTGSTSGTWSGQTKNSVAMDERVDGSAHSHASLAQAAAGATGNFFADFSEADFFTAAAAFALKPVPVGGTFRPPHPHRGLVMRYPRR